MVTVALIVLGIYLTLGVLALLVLDLVTHRVRQRLTDASYDTQSKLAQTGQYVSSRTALIIIIVALWIFWPAAIYSAITSGGNRNGKSQ